MKKVIYVFLVFQMMSIMSCCEQEITLIGAGVLTAQQEKYDYQSITTIEGTFVLFNEMEINMANNIIQNPFVNELQATSCGEVFLNDIDESSITVSVDKAFDLNGQSIAAGTNLLELDGVVSELGGAVFYIEFTSSFVDGADFLNEAYTFEVQFGTSDSQSFSNSVTLQMEI